MPQIVRTSRRLGLAFLVAMAGCQENRESPTAPEPAPALAAATTAALPFTQVSAGLFHSCGLAPGNRAYCWGANFAGELGSGLTTGSATPIAVVGGLQFVQVSAGSHHTCGVTADARAYCWGGNFEGELGDGTVISRSRPVLVEGGHHWQNVRAGHMHSCGVTTSGAAYCWGYNKYGQLGDGSDLVQRRIPVPVAGGRLFRRVSPGGLHTCGVTTNDRAFCWGLGGQGQIGDGKTFQRRTPRLVAGGLSWRQVVASGAFHSCGITWDHRAYCWGFNGHGQLGIGTTNPLICCLTPMPVAGDRQFAILSAGGDYTCGVTIAHVALCWGDNSTGSLGDGTTIERTRPRAVSGGLSFSGVSAGFGGHACGVTTDSRAYCWGGNQFGEVGDGTTNTLRLTPVPVAGPM
jgi:alpha-tubulin suppressor-like RCC1 family protein